MVIATCLVAKTISENRLAHEIITTAKSPLSHPIRRVLTPYTCVFADCRGHDLRSPTTVTACQRDGWQPKSPRTASGRGNQSAGGLRESNRSCPGPNDIMRETADQIQHSRCQAGPRFSINQGPVPRWCNGRSRAQWKFQITRVLLPATTRTARSLLGNESCQATTATTGRACRMQYHRKSTWMNLASQIKNRFRQKPDLYVCFTEDNLTRFDNTTVVKKDSVCSTKDNFTSMSKVQTKSGLHVCLTRTTWRNSKSQRCQNGFHGSTKDHFPRCLKLRQNPDSMCVHQ